MSQTHHKRSSSLNGFTLIELLVVISIIALLISILLPALSSAREAGKSVACLSNVRQLLIASHTYAADSKEYLPAAITWRAYDNYQTANHYWFRSLTIGDYVNPEGFRCPGDPNPNDWSSGVTKTTGEEISYGYSGSLGNNFLRLTSPDPNREQLFAQRRIYEFTGGSGPRSDPDRAFMLFDYANALTEDLPAIVNNKIDVSYGYSTDRLSARHFDGLDQMSASYTNFPAMSGGYGGNGNFGFVGGHAKSIASPFATSRWAMDPVFASDYEHAGFFMP